jgi:hypothetical protein
LGKREAPKKPTPVSPFSTGGGGGRFELLVAVHYLIALLRQEAARGAPDAIVQEVRLQQRNRDCPVDDIVVLSRSSASTSRLYLQVKHDVKVGKNDLFAEVVRQAWQQLTDKAFRAGTDAVGVAIGEVCNTTTIRQHVADLLHWARASSSGKSFYAKTRKFMAKERVLEAFEDGLALAIGKAPNQDDVHRLLRHFIVVPFDFDLRAGRDAVDNSNALTASVPDGDTRNAGSLGTILFEMAAEYAIAAGEITRDDLSQRITAKASFAVPILHRVGRAISDILLTRLRNRLQAEKNSKKYIPDVFVEIGDVKDSARLFCHPTLFLRKLVDDIRRLDVFDLNRFLAMTGLPLLRINVPEVGDYDSLERDTEAIRRVLAELSASLFDLSRERKAVVATHVPKNKLHVFDEVDWRIRETARALNEYEIDTLLKSIDVARARILAIVSKAGQGKTNFVCDLAQHCLAPRGIPCAYFTGKELGTVGRKQLQGFVARSVYGEGHPGGIDDLLRDIDEEAHRRGTAGIILIDAINEHTDLPVFSQEVEEFIEKCLQYPRVRVIVTCRSEYFEARFANLTKGSFADRLIIHREIQRRMSAEHRRRLIEGYLRFFKIAVSFMSDGVRKQLGEDPFLLRIFCEAYGNPVAASVRKMGHLWNLRREALFREYFKQKLGALSAKASRKTGFLLGDTHPFQDILRKTLAWMLDNDQYADVPVTGFAEKELGTLTDLVDEDILVRRDLAPASVVGTVEVLNFTFDACRDFLLSDYLLNVLAQRDGPRFQKLVGELTDPQKSVAEGLQQYLFYASRYLADPSITAFLEGQEWYETVFISSLFDLDDDAITQQDAVRLKGFCVNNHQMAPQIVVNLLVRWNPKRHHHANILTLFELFDSLDDPQFADLCNRTFRSREYGVGGGHYPIDKLTDDVKSLLLSTGDRWVSSYATLGRLMLYLWRMTGPQYYRHPAQELFGQFAAVHPAVTSRLQREHEAAGRHGYLPEEPRP